MGNTSNDKALQEIKVTERSQLLEFLVTKSVRKSRSATKSLLTHKQVRVNGRIVTQFDMELNAGDSVSVMKYDQSRKERKLKGLKIVFEDESLIVIDKEYGVLSVATEREKSHTVYSVLNEYVKKKKKDGRVFVLHRLDREVSGLMVFGKDAEIQSYFQKNWNNLVPVYTYTGIVEGVLEENKKNTVVSWLTENKNFQVFASSFDNGGLQAITHYTVLKANKYYSLVDFTPETRRKNQIRVQMQQIGHPIVGDKKYAAPSNPIKRIALHASTMVIKHPITGVTQEFKSVLPKSMQQLINR